MSKPEGLIQQANYGEEAEVLGGSATVGVKSRSRRLVRVQAPIEGWRLAGAEAVRSVAGQSLRRGCQGKTRSF